MGTEGFLGEFKCAFGVLQGTGFQELNDSFFVGGDSSNFSDDLTDEFDSFSESTFAAGWSASFGCFFGDFEFGDEVSLVGSDGNDGGMCFGHN